MRRLTLLLGLAFTFSLGIPAAGTTQASPSDPASTVTAPRSSVKVLDRGASPRRQLRYAWTVGQKEAVQIDYSMATDMALGLSPGGDVQLPTMRMITTNEVVEARPDGTWVLQQVIHDAGVPLGESDGIIDMETAEASLASLVGATWRLRVDARGILSESETIPPPGMDPAQAQSLERNTRTMEGALLALPRERVGVGAIWRIDESFVGDMGFAVKQVRRVKLLGIDGDTVRIGFTVRQFTSNRRLQVPDAPEGFRMRIDEHIARGRGSGVIDLGAVAYETAQNLTSKTEMTARMGKQVETLIMRISIDTATTPVALDQVPSPRPQTPPDTDAATRRHEVVEEGIVVSFPSRWTVGPTNPQDHPWLYPDESTDDPGWYGILIASGEGQRCTVEDDTGWIASPPAWTTLEQVVDHELSWMGRDTDIASTSSRYYELAAGRVARIDVDWASGLTETYYWFRNGRRFIELDCWSNQPPDDRWFSVAASFDFLGEQPATETPLDYVRAPRTPPDGSTALPPGLFSLAGPELSVDLPSGWEAREVTAGGDQGLLGPVEAADLPYQVPLLRLDDPDAGAFCALADITRLAEHLGWTDRLDAGYDRRDELRRTTGYHDPSVLFVHVPLGEAAIISALASDGRAYDSYIIEAPDAWLHLVCWSPDTGAHHWRSIAEALVPVADAEPGEISIEVLASEPDGVLVGDFQVGDIVAIGAAGEWCASAVDGDCGGPEGVRDQHAEVYADYRIGALLSLQSGADRPQLVADGTTIDITSAGPLRLFFNDNRCCYADNRGSVWVQLIPLD